MVSFDGIPVYLPSIFRARPCKTHRPVLANKSSSCMVKFPIVSDLVQKPGTQAEAGAIDSHPSANPSANSQKMDNAYSNHGQSFCEQHYHQHSSTIKCSKLRPRTLMERDHPAPTSGPGHIAGCFT
jgi:hypothetical protein